MLADRQIFSVEIELKQSIGYEDIGNYNYLSIVTQGGLIRMNTGMLVIRHASRTDHELGTCTHIHTKASTPACTHTHTPCPIYIGFGGVPKNWNR